MAGPATARAGCQATVVRAPRATVAGPAKSPRHAADAYRALGAAWSSGVRVADQTAANEFEPWRPSR